MGRRFVLASGHEVPEIEFVVMDISRLRIEQARQRIVQIGRGLLKLAQPHPPRLALERHLNLTPTVRNHRSHFAPARHDFQVKRSSIRASVNGT